MDQARFRILYDVFTTLGFADETEDEGNFGGDLEFGLSLWNASRLTNKPFYICSDGRARFKLFGMRQAEDNMSCTQVQSEVGEALSRIGFKSQEDESGKTGGPSEFKLPSTAAKRLRRTNILVSADGSVQFEK